MPSVIIPSMGYANGGAPSGYGLAGDGGAYAYGYNGYAETPDMSYGGSAYLAPTGYAYGGGGQGCGC